MSDRNPRDGKPFYCVKCKHRFDEACARTDCKLESEESAELRVLLVAAANPGSPQT